MLNDDRSEGDCCSAAAAAVVLAAPASMADGDDPLMLEHMMGFNGECKGSVQFHPMDPDVMISYTGCLVVISKVNNPHEQEFLRGHNEAITCLALSPSGALIASGQTSTTRVPNSEATVIVWDYKTRQPVFRLLELHDGIQFSRNRVIHLAFSPDEKFLAGADDQHSGPKMAVWHTATAQLAALDKGKDPLNFIAWGNMLASERKSQRNPGYTLLGATRERVYKMAFEFDVRAPHTRAPAAAPRRRSTAHAHSLSLTPLTPLTHLSLTHTLSHAHARAQTHAARALPAARR